jgi:hypothetical protein
MILPPPRAPSAPPLPWLLRLTYLMVPYTWYWYPLSSEVSVAPIQGPGCREGGATAYCTGTVATVDNYVCSLVSCVCVSRKPNHEPDEKQTHT